MFSRYFKSHGLKLGKITLQKANLNDDIDDFQINFLEDTKNITKNMSNC